MLVAISQTNDQTNEKLVDKDNLDEETRQLMMSETTKTNGLKCADCRSDKKSAMVNGDEQLKASGRCGLLLLRYRGMLLALIACALLAVLNICMRKTVYLNGSEQATFIYLFQITSMLIFCKIKNVNILGASDVRCLLSGRAMLGVVGLITWNFSVLLIPPSDSIALINTNVIVTAFFARIFLKEKFTIAFLVSIVLAVSGIILITQPDFLFNKYKSYLQNHTLHMHLHNHSWLQNVSSSSSSHLNLTNYNYNNFTLTDVQIKNNNKQALATVLGISFALTSACTSGLLPIVMKRLHKKNIHFSVVMIYATYFGFPIALVLSLLMHFFRSPSKIPLLLTQSTHDLPYQAAILLIIGSCTLVMQTLNYIALRYDDASKIGLIRSSSEVLFTFIAQYLFLNIDTNILRIVGGALIVAGSVLVVLFKLLDRRFALPVAAAENKNETKPNARAGDEQESFLPKDQILNSKCCNKVSKLNRFKKIIFYKI